MRVKTAVRVPTDVLPGAESLRRELLAAFHEMQRAAGPIASDSGLERLSTEIARRLNDGRLELDDIETLIRLLTVRTFLYRARRLRIYLGETDPATNEAGIASLVQRLAGDHGGNRVPFDVFRARLEREIAGIVITAHPTFGLSKELTRIMASLALERSPDGEDLGEAERDALVRRACEAPHGSPRRITLADEQDFAWEALANIHAALRRLHELILREARELYPDDWKALRPRLLTLATWVAYDLDGRTDILWNDSLRARLTAAHWQFVRYRERVEQIADMAGARSLKPDLEHLAGRLSQAAHALESDLEELPDRLGNAEEVAAFSRGLVARRSRRPLEVGILGDVERCLAAAEDESVARALAGLRTEIEVFGLGIADTHVRLNATQLANAIRAELREAGGLEDLGHRHRFLRELDKLIETVEPVTVNFGSLLAEQRSAKRLFMLVAQMLKHVGSDRPVRFLIAETESAATLLAALYFAKLFGVDDRVDLSPLFETPLALRRGHEIVAESLASPHYRSYVERRGRLCIQTGLSDSGRYIGAVASALAIERLRMKVAQVLNEAGLAHVELVIFDTHGESIGRGAHPAGFAERMDYIDTPESRRQFASLGLSVKEETSFQGADGYVYFATPEIAFTTICRILEHALADPAEDGDDDLFYRDTDYSLEFFLTLKEFNDRLFHNPSYAALLHAFHGNLMFPTGSRAPSRQRETYGADEHASPTQIRAIPHNAILQQWGFLANSLAGIGGAIAIEPVRFAETYGRSRRCRNLMSLVARARALSSLDTLAAYTSLFDPVSWLQQAYREGDGDRRQAMRRLASVLHEKGRVAPFNDVLRVLLDDAIDLRDGLAALGLGTTVADADHEALEDLKLLHALRLALIKRLFLLAMRIPRFTAQPDATTDQVVDALVHLDVETALAILRREFPARSGEIDQDAYGEGATYRSDVERGYGREHRELFDPIADCYARVREISSAICHVMGAVG